MRRRGHGLSHIPFEGQYMFTGHCLQKWTRSFAGFSPMCNKQQMNRQVISWVKKCLKAASNSFIISFFRSKAQPFRNAIHVRIHWNRRLFEREEQDNVGRFRSHAWELHECFSCLFQAADDKIGCRVPWYFSMIIRCGLLDCFGFALYKPATLMAASISPMLGFREGFGDDFEMLREIFEGAGGIAVCRIL